MGYYHFIETKQIEAHEMEKLAREVIELIDVHGWKLSQAKAFLKNRGLIITARSKDELVAKLAKVKS